MVHAPVAVRGDHRGVLFVEDLLERGQRSAHDVHPADELLAPWRDAQFGRSTIREVVLFPTLKPRTPEEQKALAEDEVTQLQQQIAQMENNIKVLLVPKDPRDDKNVIVEIRAGTGGAVTATGGAASPSGGTTSISGTRISGIGASMSIMAPRIMDTRPPTVKRP